jgi:autoinducer 2-degrading protein
MLPMYAMILITWVFAVPDKALAVAVYVSVKPGMEDAFKEASLNNAKNSVQEEGIARFDLIQVGVR